MPEAPAEPYAREQRRIDQIRPAPSVFNPPLTWEILFLWRVFFIYENEWHYVQDVNNISLKLIDLFVLNCHDNGAFESNEPNYCTLDFGLRGLRYSHLDMSVGGTHTCTSGGLLSLPSLSKQSQWCGVQIRSVCSLLALFHNPAAQLKLILWTDKVLGSRFATGL